jgi:hypothetical protein
LPQKGRFFEGEKTRGRPKKLRHCDKSGELVQKQGVRHVAATLRQSSDACDKFRPFYGSTERLQPGGRQGATKQKGMDHDPRLRDHPIPLPSDAERVAELEALVAKLLTRIQRLEGAWMDQFEDLEWPEDYLMTWLNRRLDLVRVDAKRAPMAPPSGL